MIVDLDRSTLGRNLKVLERLGYVQLAGGQDERSKIVVLTAGGKTKFEKAFTLERGCEGRTFLSA